MNCSETERILSPFYDGELTPAVCTEVEFHIESCPNCAQELAAFRTMSGMAHDLPNPQPAPGVWQDVATQLDAAKTKSAAVRLLSERAWRLRDVVIAASLLLVAGISLVLFLERDEHDHRMAVNFDHYLQEFTHDADFAQQLLVNAYPNQTVNLQQAARQLKYTPVATNELPDRYILDSVQVFEMPCCQCIQCVYKQADNSTITLFEHDSDQPIWFGKRPAVTCQCNGKPTRIVTFDGKLAASWPSGQHHLTLIGARDIKQIMKVMDHLDSNTVRKNAKPLGLRAVPQNVAIARCLRRTGFLHLSGLLTAASAISW